jgi:hypothetical protein
MRIQVHRRPLTSRWMLVCSALVILTACQQAKQPPTAAQGPNELAWARGALERNPNLEVVATDTQAGVFTVRDRTTGEVHAVKASELAAVPLSQLAAPAPTASETAKEPEAASASTAPSTSAPNDGTTAPQAAATASDTTAQSTSTGPHPYTIERSEGQLKVSGPGISIVSSGTPGAAQAAAAQRKADPIICEGQRRIQLDGRDIQVDGDAVTARAGCELYITNSRIVASGTGVVVQDAVVHIANSYIEGASGSIAAEGGSRMFLRGSTFNGLQRRDSLASVQDQGGNQWR